jgi:hypothetical protein
MRPTRRHDLLYFTAAMLASVFTPQVSQAQEAARPTCSADGFGAANDRFRTMLPKLKGRAADAHLIAWMKQVHCVVRADKGVHLSFGTRKSVMFEIGNALASRGRPCLALQGVGMTRPAAALDLSGFWNSGTMRASEAQSVNSYLVACLRADAAPFGKARNQLYAEVVRRLKKPSGLATDLRTAENRRLSDGARLAQALLDSLDMVLVLDFGKDRADRQISATYRALKDEGARKAWAALWQAMDGPRQRPLSTCVSAIRRGANNLERDLIKARALAGSRGTCG